MSGARPLRVVLTVDPVLPVPPTGYGGTQRIAAALARGLVARGHEVTVLAGPGSRTPGARDVTIRYRYPAPRLLRAAWYLRFRWLVRRSTRGADVVVSFWREDFLRGAVAPGVAIVLTHHHPIVPGGPAPQGSDADPMIRVSVSDHQRASLSAAGWTTIHNATDTRFFRPAPGRSPSGRYVAFIGRLSPEKGADVAVRVAQRAGLRLQIAGNLPDDPVAQAAFDESIAPHLGEETVWLGELDDAGKRDLLAGADALLFPIRWSEPFGLVMIEALACGTPVVATRVAAVPEVVRDGVTGFICDDEDTMVAALGRLDQLDRARCREDAVARFSEEAMVDRYLAVIGEVVEGVGVDCR